MPPILAKDQYDYYYTRILYLTDDVLQDMAVATDFIDMMLELNTRSKDPILLVVDSHGGYLSAMTGIIDTMQCVESPIYTQVTGVAASAACVAASCGAQGHRYVSPHSSIMMHQPSAFGVSGDATQIRIEAEEIARTKKLLVELLAESTGKTGKRPLEILTRDIERDKWFSAQEAVAYGLADTIGFLPELMNISLHVPVETNTQYPMYPMQYPMYPPNYYPTNMPIGDGK